MSSVFSIRDFFVRSLLKVDFRLRGYVDSRL